MAEKRQLASIIVRDEASGVEIEYRVKSDQCLGFLARHFSQKQGAAVGGICLRGARGGRSFTQADLDSTFEALGIGDQDVLVACFEQDKGGKLGDSGAGGHEALSSPIQKGSGGSQQVASGDGPGEDPPLPPAKKSRQELPGEQQRDEKGLTAPVHAGGKRAMEAVRPTGTDQQPGELPAPGAGASTTGTAFDATTAGAGASTGAGASAGGSGSITVMEALAAEHERMSAERDRLAGELQALEASRRELARRARAAAAARCDAAEELGRARGELRAQLQAAEGAGAALAEQEGALGEQRGRVGALEKELEELEGRLLEGWRGRNAEAQKGMEALQEEVGAREAQVSGLRGRLEAVGKLVAGLCGELEALAAGPPPALAESAA